LLFFPPSCTLKSLDLPPLTFPSPPPPMCKDVPTAGGLFSFPVFQRAGPPSLSFPRSLRLERVGPSPPFFFPSPVLQIRYAPRFFFFFFFLDQKRKISPPPPFLSPPLFLCGKPMSFFPFFFPFFFLRCGDDFTGHIFVLFD